MSDPSTTDSSERDSLETKRERNRRRRLERVKRWAAYVESTPPETWGPQLNRVVDAQLASVRASQPSASQLERVERAGERYRLAETEEK